jgi:hypothetical protein
MTKKICLWGVSPGQAGKDAAFARHSCRYVGELPLFENILWIQEVNENC